ncbi:MAG: Hsp20/alpha crystallin family protein [Chloroflexi bacterium]|uniref:Hsp20/alpha crystallin family protein n=1 Tax=Candidatus Chlorohelix allophototropha TaxID=3003348 RepID=A0A8T7M8J0_9CHLR|nr:Hsp20/alpha crystallin family protein [Chloroflexota bacterium]WJW68411.1 hypothetical protein OZ401_004022 [Chloroflexota bacterium L227-S17]
MDEKTDEKQKVDEKKPAAERREPPRRPQPPIKPGEIGERLNSLWNGGFFKGLNNLVEYLDELADQAERMGARFTDPDAGDESSPPRRSNDRISHFEASGRARSSNFKPNVYNRNVANQRNAPARPAAPDPAPVSTTREPMVDIFEEDGGIIVLVAEMPGANEQTIKVEIVGDIVSLSAAGQNYRYEKECLLPAPVQSEPENRRYRNGVLEMRLKRA